MDIAFPLASVSDQFKPGVRWLIFFVENIQQTVSTLEQRGLNLSVTTGSTPDAAGVVCAQDPDGILIEFVQV